MWKTLVNIFFPKYCVQCKKIGNYICDKCFSYIRFDPTPICAVCNKPSIEGATHPKCKKPYSIDGVISAVVYAGVIKRLIHQFKYEPYAFDLRDQIGHLMCESLEQNETYFNLLNNNVIITSVPLHRRRLNRRGYNHAQLLCSYVAQYFEVKRIDDLLFRIRDTKSQIKLSKKVRYSNVKNAFVTNKKYKTDIKGKLVIVVDDVATTCSTLGETAKVLKLAGAKKVWGLVFARETIKNTL